MRKRRKWSRYCYIFGIDDIAIGMLGGSLLSGITGHSANQAAMEAANADRAMQLDLAKHGMEYKVQDLIKAGLNPMLAYTSGPAHASGGGNIPNLRNPGADAAQAAISTAQMASLKADVNLKNSQAELNRAQIPKVGAEVVESESRTELNKQMIDKVVAEVKGITASAYASSALRDKLYAEIDEISARITNLNADTNVKKEQVWSEQAKQIAEQAGAYLSRMSGLEKQGMLKALWEMATNEAYRSKLQLPYWENMSNAEFSTWKRVFAPFLSDLSTIAQGTGAAMFLNRLSQPVK